MRNIVVDIYRMILRITGIQLLSLAFAVAYVSLLNLTIIYGVCLLLVGWNNVFVMVLKVFHFPYVVVPGLIMIALNLWLVLPFSRLSRAKIRRGSLVPILLYTAVSLLLFIYSRI